MGVFSRRDSNSEAYGKQAYGTSEVDPSRDTDAVASLERVKVSATDGPMPETKEQFDALRARGTTTVDVDLINAAVVDEEILELIENEIHELAHSCGLTVREIVRG